MKRNKISETIQENASSHRFTWKGSGQQRFENQITITIFTTNHTNTINFSQCHRWNRRFNFNTWSRISVFQSCFAKFLHTTLETSKNDFNLQRIFFKLSFSSSPLMFYLKKWFKFKLVTFSKEDFWVNVQKSSSYCTCKVPCMQRSQRQANTIHILLNFSNT